MPRAVERELGEVKPARFGRGSPVDTPPRDRDREIQRRPHRPERGGRRHPWRLTESFVDGRGLPRGEPTEPPPPQQRARPRPTRPTSTAHSFPLFEPGPAPMERDRIRDKGRRPRGLTAHTRVSTKAAVRPCDKRLPFTRCGFAGIVSYEPVWRLAPDRASVLSRTGIARSNTISPFAKSRLRRRSGGERSGSAANAPAHGSLAPARAARRLPRRDRRQRRAIHRPRTRSRRDARPRITSRSTARRRGPHFVWSRDAIGSGAGMRSLVTLPRPSRRDRHARGSPVVRPGGDKEQIVGLSIGRRDRSRLPAQRRYERRHRGQSSAADGR
jgi:hypothetical protein